MEQVNEITQDILSELTPTMAIIVYKNDMKYYLERRNIVDGKMAAGVPLTERCITDIFDVISSDESNIIHGRVPDNMLFVDGRVGRERIVWFRPPEKRSMFFSKDAGIPDGQMLVPGLVYSASGNKLSVYAYKGKKPKDKLFIAPFFNVSDTGVVCLGSAKVTKSLVPTFENTVAYWEKMFWASEFVHILGSNPIRNNLATVTKECINTGKPFPEDVLIESKIKLKDLLK